MLCQHDSALSGQLSYQRGRLVEPKHVARSYSESRHKFWRDQKVVLVNLDPCRLLLKFKLKRIKIKKIPRAAKVNSIPCEAQVILFISA